MSHSNYKTSKFLSLVLRHKPEKIGLTLDNSGWASIDELIAKMDSHGHCINRDLLIEIVRSSDKQRFAFNDGKTHIRANQGHSIQVNLDYESAKPPPVLFHGTVGKFLETIAEQGLCKYLEYCCRATACIAISKIVFTLWAFHPHQITDFINTISLANF